MPSLSDREPAEFGPAGVGDFDYLHAVFAEGGDEGVVLGYAAGRYGVRGDGPGVTEKRGGGIADHNDQTRRERVGDVDNRYGVFLFGDDQGVVPAVYGVRGDVVGLFKPQKGAGAIDHGGDGGELAENQRRRLGARRAAAGGQQRRRQQQRGEGQRQEYGSPAQESVGNVHDFPPSPSGRASRRLPGRRSRGLPGGLPDSGQEVSS